MHLSASLRTEHCSKSFTWINSFNQRMKQFKLQNINHVNRYFRHNFLFFSPQYPNVSFCIHTHHYGLTLFQNVCSLSIPKHFLLPHTFGINSVQLRTLSHLSFHCFYSGFTQSKISSAKLLTPHSPAPHHTYTVGIDTSSLGWLLPSLSLLPGPQCSPHQETHDTDWVNTAA